jgi:DNA-binding NtrC family response regulator
MSKKTIPPAHGNNEPTAVEGDTPPGSPGDRLCLLVSTAAGVSIVPLERNRDYTLGRTPEADVVVDDKSVSRKHVRVALEGRRITLTDLKSSNGTKVNDRRLEAGEECVLHLGSAFEMGSTTVVLQRAYGLLSDDGAPLVAVPRTPAPARQPEAANRIVRDAAMLRLYQLVSVVAPTPLNVLVLGETGVGKEVFAAAVHAMSKRADQPFVQLNCAAVPESLFESELFGHEKGAFTGATQTKAGIFESADGGTVFLDEIGEVPLSMQAKLLRVLESGDVQRIGAVRSKRVNVRFIAATNRDLRILIMDQSFRQDLYFRLNGMTLTVPPLRKRKDDILPLAEYFAKRVAAELERGVPTIGESAAEMLLQYPWPGNVRELRNVIDRAVVVAKGDTIEPEDLDLGDDGRVVVKTMPPPEAPTAVITTPPQPVAGAGAEGKREKGGAVARVAGGDLKAQVEAFEKELILEALEKAAGNQSKAARMLGISRRILILRLEQYGVPRPRKGAEGGEEAHLGAKRARTERPAVARGRTPRGRVRRLPLLPFGGAPHGSPAERRPANSRRDQREQCQSPPTGSARHLRGVLRSKPRRRPRPIPRLEIGVGRTCDLRLSPAGGCAPSIIPPLARLRRVRPATRPASPSGDVGASRAGGRSLSGTAPLGIRGAAVPPRALTVAPATSTISLSVSPVPLVVAYPSVCFSAGISLLDAAPPAPSAPPPFNRLSISRLTPLGEQLADDLPDRLSPYPRPRPLEVCLDLLLHFLRGRVPVLRPRRHRLRADRVQPLRRVGLHVARPRDLPRLQLHEDLAVPEPFPQAPPRHRLPEHHPDREHVPPPIHAPPRRLLRRHVRRLPFHHPRPRLARRVDRLRDPEIEHLHRTVVGHEHVVRRHVAMDDPERRSVVIGELVGVVEPREHLREDPEVRRQRKAPALRRAPDQPLVGLPLQVLHLDEVLLAVEPHFVRLDDVRMIQPRREARLIEEHREKLHLARELGVQLLDDLQLVEPGRPLRDREVHRPHAPAPQLEEKVMFRCATGGATASVVHAREPRSEHSGARRRPYISTRAGCSSG